MQARTISYGNLSINIKEGALGDGLGARIWVVAHTLCRSAPSHTLTPFAPASAGCNVQAVRPYQMWLVVILSACGAQPEVLNRVPPSRFNRTFHSKQTMSCPNGPIAFNANCLEAISSSQFQCVTGLGVSSDGMAGLQGVVGTPGIDIWQECVGDWQWLWAVWYCCSQAWGSAGEISLRNGYNLQASLTSKR